MNSKLDKILHMLQVRSHASPAAANAFQMTTLSYPQTPVQSAVTATYTVTPTDQIVNNHTNTNDGEEEQNVLTFPLATVQDLQEFERRLEDEFYRVRLVCYC